MCGAMVSVNERGDFDWIGKAEAFKEVIGRAVLHPTATVKEPCLIEPGGINEKAVEGNVKKIVLRHRSLEAAVCYVEFSCIGVHKLMTMKEVHEGIKQYGHQQAYERAARRGARR